MKSDGFQSRGREPPACWHAFLRPRSAVYASSILSIALLLSTADLWAKPTIPNGTWRVRATFTRVSGTPCLNFTDTPTIIVNNGRIVLIQSSTGDRNFGVISRLGTGSASQSNPAEEYRAIAFIEDRTGSAENIYRGCTYKVVFDQPTPLEQVDGTSLGNFDFSGVNLDPPVPTTAPRRRAEAPARPI